MRERQFVVISQIEKGERNVDIGHNVRFAHIREFVIMLIELQKC